jgi:hypothetical protein
LLPRPRLLTVALITALLALAGCGGSTSTTSSTPASGSGSIQDEARDLVMRYLAADSRADVHELCQSAFTDFYLRSQVAKCDDSIQFAADSVDLGPPEFHLHTENGVQVGAAVFVATLHGGPLDGKTLRIVLENDGTGWRIDESSEQR